MQRVRNVRGRFGASERLDRIFTGLKEKNCQPKILYSIKLFFRNEGEIHFQTIFRRKTQEKIFRLGKDFLDMAPKAQSIKDNKLIGLHQN